MCVLKWVAFPRLALCLPFKFSDAQIQKSEVCSNSHPLVAVQQDAKKQVFTQSGLQPSPEQGAPPDATFSSKSSPFLSEVKVRKGEV